MTTEPLSPARPEPRRDRYGRYLLPDPNTGREIPWTRVTTLAKTLSDQYGLTKWQCRMVTKGIAARPDLYALAAATPIDDKATLDRLVDDAKEAAAASSGARLGSALHSFTEQLDAGEQVEVPAPWDKDVAAYQQTLHQAGIIIDPAHIERIVVVPELGVAGTFDRILTIPDTDAPVVGDLKTGKDLSYGWGEIAIQLAIYANAKLMWDPTAGRYEPMPPMNRSDAIVIHLPVGQAKCDLYWVDIAAGWDAAQQCAAVRQWRARDDLAVKFTPITGAPAPAANGWLARVDEATTEDDLVKVWQDADIAGAWDQVLLEACKRRKAQLLTPGRIQAAQREATQTRNRL
jgi:hypothetical protein